MSKSRHIKILVFIIISILCALGTYVFLWAEMWNMGTAVSVDTAKLASDEKQKQYSQKVLTTFAGSQTAVATLRTYIVSKDGEADLIGYLESLAHTYTLTPQINTVSLISPPILADDPSVEYLSLQMGAAGTWGNVWNFAHALEFLPYAVNVKSLAFIRGQDLVVGGSTIHGWKVVATLWFLKIK